VWTHVAVGSVCLQHSRSVWRTKLNELNALHWIALSASNTPNRPATHYPTHSHTLTHTHTHSLSLPGVCLVHFAQSSESDRSNTARPTDRAARSTCSCSTHACSARPPRTSAALLSISGPYRHAQVQEVCEEDEARSGAHSHCRALPPTGHLVLA
jgi:hypothetical protein